MMLTSRWLLGLIVSLLLVILGAVGSTYRAVGTLERTLGPQVAVAVQRAEDNARGLAEIRTDIRDLRRARQPRIGE